jgi:hypothetical protein
MAGAVTQGDDVQPVYPDSFDHISRVDCERSARAWAGSQSPRVEDSEAGHTQELLQTRVST